MHPTGLVFALIAMLGWTFGDFLIQRATRQIGVWQCVFWIGLGGCLSLLPWAAPTLPTLFSSSTQLGIILAASAVGALAAASNFSAFRQGRLSIIQPILGMEIIFTTFFGYLLFHETLQPWQILLVLLACVGLFLISLTHGWQTDWKKPGVERGVAMGLVGAILLAASNTMTGLASRSISPLTATWAIHTCIMLVALVMIVQRRELANLLPGLKKHAVKILTMVVLDNVAWLAFAYALVVLPIAVATTIGLGYVPLGCLLGVFVNRERLTTRQKIGITCLLIAIFAFGIGSS